MQKISVVDIQHKTFKKALQGYDRAEVDQYLDEIIETLEDEAQARAALEAVSADLRERVSHFKAMEESLHNTLLLAQRTADEIKASAHKEADLIKAEARIVIEREIAGYADRSSEARREMQRAVEMAEKTRSELRSLLMTHLALLERPQTTTGRFAALENAEPAAPVQTAATAAPAATAPAPAESAPSAAPTSQTERLDVTPPPANGARVTVEA
jgi:cell division initiation protein